MKLDPFLTELDKNWESIKPSLIAKSESELFRTTPISFNPPSTISIRKVPGIYLFFIEPTIDLTHAEFIERWRGKEKKGNSSKIKKTKLKILEKGKTYPLYIGKSEELLSRVSEHCFQPIDKTTYSLKMSHRAEIIEVAKFSFGVYELNMEGTFKNHLFQFVLVNLERELRNIYHPLIGKQ